MLKWHCHKVRMLITPKLILIKIQIITQITIPITTHITIQIITLTNIQIIIIKVTLNNQKYQKYQDHPNFSMLKIIILSLNK